MPSIPPAFPLVTALAMCPPSMQLAETAVLAWCCSQGVDGSLLVFRIETHSLEMLIYPFSQSVSLLMATKRKQTTKHLQGLVHNCTNAAAACVEVMGCAADKLGSHFQCKIHEGGRNSDPGVLLGPGQCPGAAQNSVCNVGAHEHRGSGAGVGLAVCIRSHITIPAGRPATDRPLPNTGEWFGCSSRTRKGLRTDSRAKCLLVRFCKGKYSFHFAHSKRATSAHHLLCKKWLSVHTVASPGEHCTVTAQEPGKGTAMQSSPGTVALPPWAAHTHLLH